MTVQEKLDYIIDNGLQYLNDWENEFIDNIQVILSRNPDDRLSIKQWQTLTKIYHKVEDNLGNEPLEDRL